MLTDELIGTLRAHLAADGLEYAEPPRRLGGGFFTENLAFRLSGAPSGWDGPLVLRLFPSSAAQDLATREAAVQSALVVQGFPAAEVLWFDDSARLDGRRGFVMRRLAGRAVVEGIEPRTLPRTVRYSRRLPAITAAVQARLHRQDPEGLAEVLAGAAHGVDRSLTKLGASIDGGAVGFGDAAQWLGDHRPRTSGPRVICHGDLWGGNILVDRRGEVTGVLDWSTSCVAEPVLDVGATALAFCLIPVPLPGPLRSALELRGKSLYDRYLREYRGHSDADLDARPYYEALRCATELSLVADWRIAETANDAHDLPRPSWDAIPGSLVEFFRSRTGVTITLPEPAA